MRESYVPNFKVPGRRGPSGSMWVTLSLCVLLPPLGLMLLWGRARCPLRGKVWISSVSLIVMIAMLTLILNWRERASYVVPQIPVAYVYGSTPTPAPEAVSEAVPGPQDQTAEDGALPSDVIIPGNPMG